MGRGQRNFIDNAERKMMTQVIERDAKQRQVHRQGLIDGKPESLAWAKRVGLTHWHSIGFGCGPNCLEGVGVVVDPEAVNFITKKPVTEPPETEERKSKRMDARKKAMASETRLRKAGVSNDTGRY